MRLAELTGTLSLAADAGTGMPEDHGLRAGVLASRFGEVLGASAAVRADAYYLALLGYIGCTAHSELATSFFGDEVAFGREAYGTDFGNPREMLPAVLKWSRRDKGRVAGAVAVARTLGKLPKMPMVMRAHCEVADLLAGRLKFSAPFRAALVQRPERWDGSGGPRKLRGEAIAFPMRIAQVSEVVEVGHRTGGLEGARALVTKLAGRGLDPELAGKFAASAADVCVAVEGPSMWQAALDAEPTPHRMVAPEGVDEALSTLAMFADLKSRYTRGHSPAVSELASRAARRLGLGAAAETDLRRAGLLHDIGRVAVSAGLWDKAGPLSDLEREKVRLHTYVGERVLSRATGLAAASEIASLAHERLDGSGYHRRLAAAGCSPAARLLAAADVYCALTEERPHRSAREPDGAAGEIARMAEAGALCPEATRAVLDAAGQTAARVENVVGLTDREVAVLRLLGRGLTNKEIASALEIATRTAGHHVEHVFEKLGVTTRAAAAVCAMQRGLAG